MCVKRKSDSFLNLSSFFFSLFLSSFFESNAKEKACSQIMHGRPRAVPGAPIDPEKAKAAAQRVRRGRRSREDEAESDLFFECRCSSKANQKQKSTSTSTLTLNPNDLFSIISSPSSRASPTRSSPAAPSTRPTRNLSSSALPYWSTTLRSTRHGTGGGRSSGSTTKKARLLLLLPLLRHLPATTTTTKSSWLRPSSTSPKSPCAATQSATPPGTTGAGSCSRGPF